MDSENLAMITRDKRDQALFSDTNYGMHAYLYEKMQIFSYSQAKLIIILQLSNEMLERSCQQWPRSTHWPLLCLLQLLNKVGGGLFSSPQRELLQLWVKIDGRIGGR